MDKLEKIFSVSEYVDFLNIAFKNREDKLLGEVSQVTRASSGHVYFSLKDPSGEAVLSCIAWKMDYARSGIDLEVGMEVLLTGKPNIYGPTGRFSFVASTIELRGEGALKKAYDDLKKKLEKEGVFDIARKRTVPEFVHKIGVVTSREGAVIHDFINNLGKYGYHVYLVDSRVEGQQAVKPLLEAVHTLRDKEIDVLVMIRGGGSLESLQAYNNEMLVKEIVDFPVPVLAGIGHDQDVPLLALAADQIASTPTATAHLINKSWEEAFNRVGRVRNLLPLIGQEIKRLREVIRLTQNTLLDHAISRIDEISSFLKNAEQTIKLSDPKRQLALGYAILRSEGKIVKSISELDVGQGISTELGDGKIESSITKINK